MIACLYVLSEKLVRSPSSNLTFRSTPSPQSNPVHKGSHKGDRAKCIPLTDAFEAHLNDVTPRVIEGVVSTLEVSLKGTECHALWCKAEVEIMNALTVRTHVFCE